MKKGKVYPSPSSSSSSSSSSSAHGHDYLSVLKLLPAAILVLASVLSVEDCEVLAYLITRSLKTTTTTAASISTSAGGVKTARTRSPASASSSTASKKKSSKKLETHKSPVFDCDCFDCYTSYWLRWDSSPNRELIHQAIEAFEDHLTSGEAQKPKKNSNRGKKKEKSGHRVARKSGRPDTSLPETSSPALESQEPVVGDFTIEVSPKGHLSPGRAADYDEDRVAELEKESAGESPVVARLPAGSGNKGLVRKVLADVLGLFKSRLWSLWNPNA